MSLIRLFAHQMADLDANARECERLRQELRDLRARFYVWQHR